MSPRTVQIWFQNKRQSWRANKAKIEQQGTSTSAGGGGITTSGPSSGSFSPHPLRQEHFGSGPPPNSGRMPSAGEENVREEGMENDEGGGWAVLQNYRSGGRGHEQDDEGGFDDDGASMHSPHHRPR
jgi:hypothetical protein